jgi:hypothetical protein
MSNTYDKPKVTIDLEEYNHLNKRIKELSEGEVSDYQKAVLMVMNYAGNPQMFRAEMGKIGLQLTVWRGMDGSVERVSVSKISKT